MNKVLSLFLMSVLVFAITPAGDVMAQSGSRGRAAPRGSYGIPSRVGGARSKTVPSNARPTGMMNSANAVRQSGGGRSAGSGSRPSAGYSPRSSSIGGSGSGGLSRPATGISRPSRTTLKSSLTSRSGGSSSDLVSANANSGYTARDGFRRWTDASGRYSIQGKLAGQRDGTVWIRRSDGRLSRLTVSQLSQADQQFLGNSRG